MVNEYLERTLVAYYRRQDASRLGCLVACAVGLGTVVAWVMVTKPEAGWFSAPVALVGVPCAFGLLVYGALVWVTRRKPVLELLRMGIGVSKVKRGITVVSRRPDRPQLIERHVPTVFVEFSDGRASRLLSLGDLEQLTRIEELLRKQMAQAHPR